MEDLNKEEKMFLKSLNVESAEPNTAFKARLLNEVTNEYNQKTQWGLFSFGLLGIAAFSLIIILFGASFLNQSLPQSVTIEDKFSQSEKESIYEQILKNNPVGIIKANILAASNKSANLDTTIIPSIQKKSSDISLLTEYITETKVLSNTCNLDINSGKTTLTEYIDKERYFAKSITENLDNEVIFYNLISRIGLKTSEYFYTPETGVRFDTSTAFESKLEISSYPVSAPLIANPELKLFDDSNLLEKVRLNGSEFYVLETRSDINCLGKITSYPVSFASQAKDQTKLVSLSYFNAVSFNLEFTETYLNEKLDSNLLFAQSFSKREQSISLDELQKEFSYNLEDLIKTTPTSYII